MRPDLLLAAVGLTVLSVACVDRPLTDASGRPRVVTTISPITNIVGNVGGDRVVVAGIVPEGTNSHTFEPAPSDARLFSEADVVFMNGLNLEEPTRRLAESNVRPGVPIIKLGDRTITPDQYIYDFSFPKAEGDPNPHLWTNPLYARRYAEIAAEELTRLDPEGAGQYRRNLDAFVERVDELDRLVRQVTATVPPGNRMLLTYHDSFPYFAREYGWTIVGAIQPSDFSEPTPREIAALIRQIRAQRIPAIFGSEVFASPVLAQIARETGARFVDQLRDDDLPGRPGDPEHTYLGLMVFNFRIFMRALGGDVSAFDGFDVSNVGTSSGAYRR